MRDLHSALQTEVIASHDARAIGVQLALVKLQHGKHDVEYTLHARPVSYSSAGIQTTDLLDYLGFRRSPCTFVGDKCYVRRVEASVDVDKLAEAFSRAYAAMRQAEVHLDACGIFLDHPEGISFFYDRPPRGRRHGSIGSAGDGHVSPIRRPMKNSEDEGFQYAFTWITGGHAKGWTTHYRPKHPPLSAEVKSAFDFLGLRAFPECPEFDFEPCNWRFTPYEQEGDSVFLSNAEVTSRWFDAHAEHFSPGVEQLLAAQLAIQPFGMAILPAPTPQVVPSQPTKVPASASSGGGSTPSRYEYDVAISFAGTERHLALRLATTVREAGFQPFYDTFYPEQLWGKDLGVFFDDVYRKKSRYCVILASEEYVERMWTNRERQSAVARAIEEKGKEYILPIKVDPVEIPGVLPTIGYLSLGEYSIEAIAEILVKKLQGRSEASTAQGASRRRAVIRGDEGKEEPRTTPA